MKGLICLMHLLAQSDPESLQPWEVQFAKNLVCCCKKPSVLLQGSWCVLEDPKVWRPRVMRRRSFCSNARRAAWSKTKRAHFKPTRVFFVLRNSLQLSYPKRRRQQPQLCLRNRRNPLLLPLPPQPPKPRTKVCFLHSFSVHIHVYVASHHGTTTTNTELRSLDKAQPGQISHMLTLRYDQICHSLFEGKKWIIVC